MNVKRLGPDSADPEIYRKRLEAWEAKVEAAGGSGWLTLLNAGKLPGVLEAMRS